MRGERAGGNLLHPKNGAAPCVRVAVLGSEGSKSWREPVPLQMPALASTGSDPHQVPRSCPAEREDPVGWQTRVWTVYFLHESRVVRETWKLPDTQTRACGEVGDATVWGQGVNTEERKEDHFVHGAFQPSFRMPFNPLRQLARNDARAPGPSSAGWLLPWPQLDSGRAHRQVHRAASHPAKW